MKGIIIDIETLANTSNAVIIEIAAIYFEEFEVKDTFNQKVQLQSCLDLGLEINENTLCWWLKQDRKLLDVLKGGESITSVLNELSIWIRKYEEIEVWANSPSFDLVILQNAFNKAGLQYPFNYLKERDLRTIKSLTNTKLENNHNALEDCIHELRILVDFKEKYARI